MWRGGFLLALMCVGPPLAPLFGMAPRCVDMVWNGPVVFWLSLLDGGAQLKASYAYLATSS